MRRSIELTEDQRTALRLIAAKYDLTTQALVSLAVDELIRCHIQQDEILKLAIVKAAGVSWDELHAYIVGRDNLRAAVLAAQ